MPAADRRVPLPTSHEGVGRGPDLVTDPRAAGRRFRRGGEEGGRTRDTTFAVWRFSKALPSATRPPLRCRSYALNRPAGSNRKVLARRAWRGVEQRGVGRVPTAAARRPTTPCP